MAKTRIDVNTQALKKQIVEKIGRVTDNDELKQDIGLFATERVRFQARIGKPLNDSGDFPSLRPATRKQREYLEQYNQTDSTYDKDRSNLTFTGQLLNALGFIPIKDGIQFKYKDKRKPYRTGPNSRAKKTPTNSELSLLLSTLGFFVFTKEGIESNRKFNRQINQIVRRFIRRKLR